MKRFPLLILPALLSAALTLSACGGSAARSAVQRFSEDLAAQESLTFCARIRAEYDESSAEFTLQYAADGDGCRVSVLSPEIIRGVSAYVRAGETALEYDGVSLDTGSLDSYGLSPMSALPLLVETMRSGYLDTAWEEGEQLRAVLVPANGVSVEIHLDKHTLTPLSAEISSDGRVRVFAEIYDWSPTGLLIDENIQEES